MGFMWCDCLSVFVFFCQAEGGIRDIGVTGVQTCALPIWSSLAEVAGLEIVGHADCVADGILEIRKAKPDVVILDIRMPDGSGIEVLESLKKHPSPPTVIMLRNYNFPQFRRKCR